jgi:hypothetical protein
MDTPSGVCTRHLYNLLIRIGVCSCEYFKPQPRNMWLLVPLPSSFAFAYAKSVIYTWAYFMNIPPSCTDSGQGTREEASGQSLGGRRRAQ